MTAHRQGNRWAEPGDLIFHEGNTRCPGGTGVVTDVRGNPGLGSTGVFIAWAGEIPWDYNPKYGYSHINVHNQFDIFTIVKQT